MYKQRSNQTSHWNINTILKGKEKCKHHKIFCTRIFHHDFTSVKNVLTTILRFGCLISYEKSVLENTHVVWLSWCLSSLMSIVTGIIQTIDKHNIAWGCQMGGILVLRFGNRDLPENVFSLKNNKICINKEDIFYRNFFITFFCGKSCWACFVQICLFFGSTWKRAIAACIIM